MPCASCILETITMQVVCPTNTLPMQLLTFFRQQHVVSTLRLESDEEDDDNDEDVAEDGEEERAGENEDDTSPNRRFLAVRKPQRNYMAAKVAGSLSDATNDSRFERHMARVQIELPRFRHTAPALTTFVN
eukprot:GHVT01067325.1.p1 GENE.GHVT01067325.1~~GHVT01067325.1.p1  ORF type:complete len:131 (+),score=18.07 GHVT01067325.1:2593-2985(+)